MTTDHLEAAIAEAAERLWAEHSPITKTVTKNGINHHRLVCKACALAGSEVEFSWGNPDLRDQQHRAHVSQLIAAEAIAQVRAELETEVQWGLKYENLKTVIRCVNEAEARYEAKHLTHPTGLNPKVVCRTVTSFNHASEWERVE